MQKIKTILFDFDGVILNSAPDICNAVNATLMHFSLPHILSEKIISFVGDGAKKLIERALCYSCAQANLQRQHSVDDILQWYLNYYTEHAVIDSVLYPHVIQTLEVLAIQKMRMGIVSNKPLVITKKILSHFSIDVFFDCIICPEIVHHIKPHPEGILKALEELHADAGSTLMVGDSATDIQAARNAHVFSCAFLNGLGNRSSLCAENADFEVSDFMELLTLEATEDCK